MKKLFFIAAFSVTALVSASNVAKTTTSLKQLPTPKDIIKYGEKELNATCALSVNNGPGDDDIIISPPRKKKTS